MDSADIIMVLLGIAAALILVVVFFFIGVVIAYATGWMLENWFGWCDVNTTIYRTVTIPLVVFGGYRFVANINDD